jgi:hypothetical protein
MFMKKHEYSEGPKALDKFERGMEALFQVPKDAANNKKKPAKKRAKSKTSERDVSRDSGEDA